MASPAAGGDELRDLRPFCLEWAAANPRKFEAAAALRDVEALLELSPMRPSNIVTGEGSAIRQLWNLAAAIEVLISTDFAPSLRPLVPPSANVGSPYAGPLSQGSAAAPSASSPPTRAALRIAVLNPGRSDLLQLGAELLLERRLEAVAHALVTQDVDLCILPGARFPSDACLPLASPRNCSRCPPSVRVLWPAGAVVGNLGRLRRGWPLSYLLRD